MIGIRHEDKNEWERRAPLTPDHVDQLVAGRELAVTVQPSTRRAFPDLDYRRAGAVIGEDLSACDVILGIKEIPLDQLQPGKTYVFFSHTTKGQAANMPLLRRLMDLGCTMIDFEHITDERGRRLIFFGRHAGYAGMIDGLWALGRRLAVEGHATPLERVRRAYDYSSLDEATQHISRVGEQLRHVGLPDGLRPLVFGFTGSGNVSKGAQEIFDRLPSEEVLPEELQRLARDADRPKNILYKVVFSREHRFNRFADWLDDLTVLVHGAFWTPDQPRLVSREDLQRIYRRERPRLRLIVDISCDVGGAIESTVRTTTPGKPTFVYDPEIGVSPDGLEGPGVVMLAVDNLPCELPVESSDHFGDLLFRFVPVLDRCDFDRPFGELNLPQPLLRAVVVHRGELTPGFAGLETALEQAGCDG